MLNNYNQTNSFDQFLLLHFNLKDSVAPMIEIQEATAKKIRKCTTVIKKSTRTKKELVLSVDQKVKTKKLKTAKEELKSEFADLAKVIDSIPDKVRAMNLSELAHKHESEWYHAFRDLKDEISSDISKKHPNHLGVLKMKSEIKEFTEQLDEHIEKVILELERIFQAFPNMSRVAVIYLLSIIIAIPLMFFSMGNSKSLTYNFQNDNVALIERNTQILTSEMKSDYIAKNSAKILASGKTVIDVNDIPGQSKVAGAYEEKNETSINPEIRQKISSWYKYINNVKDELGNFFSK